MAPKRISFSFELEKYRGTFTAKINAVSLANNHVLDYGYTALFDTLESLDRSGILHAGAGQDNSEAEKPVVVDAGGRRIALVAFTDNEAEWETRNNTPGIFYVPVDPQDSRASHLFRLVHETKKSVDIMIVSAHWGPNWEYEPPNEHHVFAHALIDAGADVVFGHSGHVFRGIELYRGKPIIYCAGDFIDDYEVDPVERNDDSFIFELEIRGTEILGIRLYPVEIGMCRAVLARGSARTAIIAKMEHLCSRFKTKTLFEEGLGCLYIPR